MFITSHVLAGVVISQHAENPATAFLLSLASHYLLDMIPHGDDNLSHWTKKESPISRLFFTVSIDLAILCIILVTFFLKTKLPTPPVFFASVIGGVLPDAVYLLDEFFSKYTKKVFSHVKRYTRFFPPSILLHYQKKVHYVMHRVLPFRISMAKGLFVQALLIIGCIILIT